MRGTEEEAEAAEDGTQCAVTGMNKKTPGNSSLSLNM